MLEEELREQIPGEPLPDAVHDRMMEVMDNASDLIQSCDSSGCLLFVNKSWQNVLGYTSDEVIGMSVFDVIHPDSKDHCKGLVQKIAEVRSVKDEEVSLISKDGKQIFTRANINCQFDLNGVPKGTQAIFRDITATRQAELEAKGSEARYRLLVESANDVIYQGDPYGNLLYINELGVDLTGYSMDELHGIHFRKLVREDYKKEVSDFYATQFTKRIESTYLEFPIVRKDGSHRWVGQKVRMLCENESAQPITGFLGVVRDITDKRRIEDDLIDSKKELERRVKERTIELLEANDRLQTEIEGRRNMERYLHESKQEYERLFQNAHDAIIIFRPDDERVLEVNQRACRLYGIGRDEFIGMSLEKISTDIPNRKNLIEKTISKKDYSHFEIDQKTPSGGKLILEINALPIVYMGQDAILSINRDITKRHELDQKLQIERKQRVTSLIDGQEIERRRFAKELHDGLGQMLTASVHHLREIKRSGQLNETQQQILRETEEMNQKIIEETRRISKNLMPAVLEDFGLVLALQNLVNSLDSEQPTVTFYGCDKTPRFTKEAEVALYRIAQEALNNALKHAEAKEIKIKLSNDEDKITLTISDDGKGFCMNERDPIQCNGLSNMQERAEVVGAGFDIISSEASGTAVEVIFIK